MNSGRHVILVGHHIILCRHSHTDKHIIETFFLVFVMCSIGMSSWTSLQPLYVNSSKLIIVRWSLNTAQLKTWGRCVVLHKLLLIIDYTVPVRTEYIGKSTPRHLLRSLLIVVKSIIKYNIFSLKVYQRVAWTLKNNIITYVPHQMDSHESTFYSSTFFILL